MKLRPLALPILAASCLLSSPVAWGEAAYQFVPKFLTPPEGRETLGSGHGEIQVDSAGKIYVSVEGQEGGIQVYGPDGKYLRTLALPSGLHGFSIRKVAGEEFIIAAVLGQQRVIKASLAGEVLMEIPTSAFPAEIADRISVTLKDGRLVQGHSPMTEGDRISVTLSNGRVEQVDRKEIARKAVVTLADGKKVEGINPEVTESSITLKVGAAMQTIALSSVANKGGKPAIVESAAEKREGLKLTSADVAPNGDIYVVDGYGTSWIFVFDSKGQFKRQFGGPGEPFGLSNCHKVHVDNRFEPARLFLCDRGNKRIMHASLEGELIGVIAAGLRNPSSASFHGELVCIAEIAGRVSVWDKEGKLVAELGVNNTAGQTNTPGVAPADWRDDVVTSPHGITFDGSGNILETEWNKYGRVLRWDRK
ncbi:MAG: hypothetical protein RLZZ244_654 [Verrucomicrobiota bacterium]